MMARLAVIEKSTPEANHGYDELNVFKTLPGGEVIWCGSFASLESARTRINELLVTEPGEYLIHNHRSGQKLFFKSEQPALESTGPEVS